MIRALLLVVALAGCSSADCRATCDGCCKNWVCVPLAQTNRTQCGHDGAQCVDGTKDYCPVCENGFCSTGLECFSFRPAVCECGSQGNSECGFDCGSCRPGRVCVDYRCVLPGPADAGSEDGG